MVIEPEVSGMSLKELRAEINSLIRGMTQEELRNLFITLATEDEMGQLFNLITEGMSKDSVTLLTMELRLLDPTLHKKYRRGLRHLLAKKEKEEQWMKVTQLKV